MHNNTSTTRKSLQTCDAASVASPFTFTITGPLAPAFAAFVPEALRYAEHWDRMDDSVIERFDNAQEALIDALYESVHGVTRGEVIQRMAEKVHLVT